jgi:hypothetical protein
MLLEKLDAVSGYRGHKNKIIALTMSEKEFDNKFTIAHLICA